MGYAEFLFKAAVNSFIPFADKIPGMEEEKGARINKKEEKQRLAIGKAMEKSINQGEFDPSYLKAAQTMQQKAADKLYEHNLAEDQYFYVQLGKAVDLVGYIAPASTLLVAAKQIQHIGNAKALYDNSKERPLKNVVEKVASFAFLVWGVPAVLPLATSLVSPS